MTEIQASKHSCFFIFSSLSLLAASINSTNFTGPENIFFFFSFHLRKWIYKYVLLLIGNPASFLALTSPPPAAGAAIVPEISVVEDQGQVVGIIADVVHGGDADARTPFEGSEESRCDTIDAPHGYAVELSAGGWGVGGGGGGGGGSGPRPIGGWPEIEEASAGGGGGGGSHELETRVASRQGKREGLFSRVSQSLEQPLLISLLTGGTSGIPRMPLGNCKIFQHWLMNGTEEKWIRFHVCLGQWALSIIFTCPFLIHFVPSSVTYH